MNRTTTPAGPVARIAADSRPVLVFTVAGTAAVALAAFALSFAALRDAALWGRVPENLAFLVPVVIDASVLVYGLVALVLRARGRSTAWAWTLMFGFTVVSIGANAAHAYNVPPQVQALVGVVLVALAPLSVLTSTHALASLVVADEPAPVAVAERVPATADVEPSGQTNPAAAVGPATAPAELEPGRGPATTPTPATATSTTPAVAAVSVPASPSPSPSPSSASTSSPSSSSVGGARPVRAVARRVVPVRQATLPGLDVVGADA